MKSKIDTLEALRERVKTFLRVRQSARSDDYPWSQLNDATDIMRAIDAALAQLHTRLADLQTRFDLELDEYAKDSDITAANARAEAAEAKLAEMVAKYEG